jgi:hypothetical protein
LLLLNAPTIQNKIVTGIILRKVRAIGEIYKGIMLFTIT